ncbi:3-deoxy-7-phosphoheptulonate synthase [Streptomyces sp. NPDC048595]|uniref:3-deoxy-7-phosphoheptulonate synthase n=1 Tax=Streptomyces sp. NPDC048595 TaxID=3365576 RepID=UPI0037142146
MTAIEPNDPGAASALRRAVADLEGRPPLVFPDECDRLRTRLAAVARGEAFVLLGGGRAPTGEVLTTLLRMAVVLSYAGSVPVVKVAATSGADEPSGTPGSRVPDAERLRRTYHASAAALNLLRGLTAGHHTGLRRTHRALEDFVARSPARAGHRRLTRDIGAAIRFMEAAGATGDAPGTAEFFAGHPAHPTAYESALTRVDERGGRAYGLSGHLLWIGGGTRGPDGSQVEFAAGIGNPLGVVLGPAATADEALALIDRLDPERVPGRLTFLVRMGAAAVRDRLPELVAKVAASGAEVGWVCDPMHGGTGGVPSGTGTRRLADVLDEVGGFFEVHRALGTHPGGVRLELTGDPEPAAGARLLSPDQALELAFAIAGLYGSR